MVLEKENSDFEGNKKELSRRTKTTKNYITDYYEGKLEALQSQNQKLGSYSLDAAFADSLKRVGR